MSPFVGLPYEEPNGCWRLLQFVYQQLFNLRLPTYAAQSSGMGREQLAALISCERGDWREVECERPGDAVLFNIFGAASHIGIVQCPGMFLHVMRPGDTSRIESYRSPAWRNRIEGFYRHESFI